MPSPLSSPLLILDGALGTTLESPPYNIRFSSATTPLWSSHLLTSESGRGMLRDVHGRFVREGEVDVLLTGSYQGGFEGFAATKRLEGGEGEGEGEGIGEEEAGRLLRGSVRLAKEAFGAATATSSGSSSSNGDPARGKGKGKGIVALSLGPYGATLIPGAEYSGLYGDGPREGLKGWHARRLDVFASHPETWREVDVVAFETIPRVDEVRAVREIMTQLKQNGAGEGEGKPWWVSCVFPNDEVEGGGYTLPDGATVREVVKAMLGGEGVKPWGIGLNCTKIWKVRAIVEAFEEAVAQGEFEWRGRLVLYPDGAGNLVYDTKTQEWKAREDGMGKESAGREKKMSWDEEMAEIVREVQARGRWEGIVVGGCCKTTPEDIGALSARLKGKP